MKMIKNTDRIYRALLSFALPLTLLPNARPAVTEYHLTIAEQTVDKAQRTVEGMTINGSIPGPTLRFVEGDTARIQVTNAMGVPTSIHWHGLLVPPGMDGVPFISFPPIHPGKTFTYEFPIRQSGTYWYHSHSDLQEQSGVYGSIVILPRNGDPRFPELKEQVVLLSDWTNEGPHEVMHTLRAGNEYYSIRKRSSQSVLGAIRIGLLKDYLTRELQRMPAMDISDVAYDRFLLNGEVDDHLPAQVGEQVRLRIIDGSASTFFHLQFAGSPMTIIAADGQDVEPIQIERLLIGVAETYDVLVTVPADGQFEFRATSHDRSGRASLWIGEGEKHYAPLVPAPNLYKAMGNFTWKKAFALTPAGVIGMPDDHVKAGDFDRPGMNMGDMVMTDMAHGDHDPTAKSQKADPMNAMSHDAGHQSMSAPSVAMHPSKPIETGQPMPPMVAPPTFAWMVADISSQPLLAEDASAERPWPPYARLRATQPTTLDPAKPVHEIRLTLDGDMERYVWFINNTPLSASDSIRIREGEVVRFIMINQTMMHHPMHMHGHFFRVINGQGDHAPLKHTVDVEPMSTTVIEFDANEKGDWFFHCHLLYHMHAGMARVVEYEGFEPDSATAATRWQLYEDPYFLFGRAAFVSNMTEGWAEYSNSRNIFGVEWQVGWGNVPETEWEVIPVYERYLNRFTTVFVGGDFLGAETSLEGSRGIVGLAYTLPLNLYSRSWIGTDGDARFALAREVMLTPRIALEMEVKYDLDTQWEGMVALDYVLTKNTALELRWHSEFGWGGGVSVLF
ncbi:MAG: multicopper oxidase domain-containing protein [Opitutaceae bacterium]